MVGIFLLLSLVSASEPKAPGPIMFAAVKTADVAVKGPGRTAAGFAKEVESLRPFLSACANEDGKEGKTQLQLLINGDGSLSAVDAAQASPKMQSCLRGTLASTRFSLSETAATQTITVTMRSVKGEAPRHGSFAQRGTVKNVVQAHMSDIQGCYDIAPPQLGDGEVTLRIVVGNDGGVFDVEPIAASKGFASVGKCLKDKAAKWKWPAPQGGRIVITHPFSFKKMMAPPPPESR